MVAHTLTPYERDKQIKTQALKVDLEGQLL